MTTEITESQDEQVQEEVQVEELTLMKELRQALSQNLVTLGMKSTVKELKDGKLAKVILSKNSSDELRTDVQHYAELSETIVENFDGTSTELGAECKRAHDVLIVGIKKSDA